MIAFERLDPDDLFAIARQDSQVLWLGTRGDISREAAELLAAQPVAWTAWAEGRIIACFGISETFSGVQGVAWALLSDRLGAHHLALTRFMQGAIRECGLTRVELLAKARDVEAARAAMVEAELHFDGAMLVAAAMRAPTVECRFAQILGFDAAHVLRKFGAANETYMLFERIA